MHRKSMKKALRWIVLIVLCSGTQAMASDYYLHVDLSGYEAMTGSNLAEGKKDKWEFNSSNEAGFLHFHYKNDFGKSASSGLGGVELIFSVGKPDSSSERNDWSVHDNEGSILGNLGDQQKNNDRFFMMSIGTSWK